MQKVKVENMTSAKGNKVPNQFKLYTSKGVYFQSYQTIIAYKPYTGKIILDIDWDYSVTTGKYRNLFLGENIVETRKKIKDGTYVVKSLN